MTKREGLGSGINLKQFYEASVRALQSESKTANSQDRAAERKRALVQRTAPGETLKRRAMANAAEALTALWKMRPSTKTI
jgi:hypothetical protein